MVEISSTCCDDFPDKIPSKQYGFKDKGAHVVQLFHSDVDDRKKTHPKVPQPEPVLAPELLNLLSQHSIHLPGYGFSPQTSFDTFSNRNGNGNRMALIRETSDSSLHTPSEFSTVSVTSPEIKLQEYAQELAELKAERTRLRSGRREHVLSDTNVPTKSEFNSSSIVSKTGTVCELEEAHPVSTRSSEETLPFLDACDGLNDDTEIDSKNKRRSVDFSYMHSVYRTEEKHEEAILLTMKKYVGKQGMRSTARDEACITDTPSSQPELEAPPTSSEPRDEEHGKDYPGFFETIRKSAVPKHTRFRETSLISEMESASASGSTTPRQFQQRSSRSSRQTSRSCSHQSSKTSFRQTSKRSSHQSSRKSSRQPSKQSSIEAIPSASVSSHHVTSLPPIFQRGSPSSSPDSSQPPTPPESRSPAYPESRSPAYPESRSPTPPESRSTTPPESRFPIHPESRSPSPTVLLYPTPSESRLRSTPESCPQSSKLPTPEPLGTHPTGFQEFPVPASHTVKSEFDYPVSDCRTEDCASRSDRSDRSCRRKSPMGIPITIDGRVVYPEVVFAEETQKGPARTPLRLFDKVKSFAKSCVPHQPTSEPPPDVHVFLDGNPESEKTSEKLNSALLNRLTCVECGTLCTPPVAMCVWGHVVCEECRPVSLWENSGRCWCRKRCPQCSGDMLSQPCELWSNIARSLLYPCRFTKNGCREAQGLSHTEKLDHEQKCLCRVLRCWSPGCTWRGFWHQLRLHVARTHLPKATRADWYRFVTICGASAIGRSTDVISLPPNEIVLLHSLAVIGEHRYLLQYLNDDRGVGVGGGVGGRIGGGGGGGGGAVMFLPRFRLRIVSGDGKSEVEVRGEAVGGQYDVERALRSGRCSRLSSSPFGRGWSGEQDEKVSVLVSLEKGRMSVS